MPTKSENRITLILSPDAVDFINSRTRPISGGQSISESATTAIERYAFLVRQGKRAIDALLSKEEKMFLRDVLNGTLVTSISIHHLWMEVADAESHYAEKWGIDATTLITRLREMPLHALVAIIEDVEEFWRSPE